MDDGASTKQMYQHIQDGLKMTPFLSKFPCDVENVGHQTVSLRFYVEGRYCNAQGIAHGGVLAAFCDTVMGVSTRTVGCRVTTIEINMNYIRPVTAGQVIHGVGRIVHQGKRTIIVECECSDDEGSVVAKARSSFFILGTWEKQS
jgi:uncharacterized protein (TIGR00369 family)